MGNALYFVLDGEGVADNTVASIRFADHARTLPVFGAYRPAVYGYNAAGRLVDTDVKGAVFTAPEGFAEAVDGRFSSPAPVASPSRPPIGDMKASIPDHRHRRRRGRSVSRLLPHRRHAPRGPCIAGSCRR